MQNIINQNKFKTALIVAIIFAILSLVVYFICNLAGIGEYAVTVALLFSTISSFVSYWFSAKIVLKMNKAKPADTSLHADAFNALKRVCASAGIEMPALYVMDDPSPNAFATGRGPKNAVVCVTTGLLNKLEYYQLEGVIAHEVAHITNYDILLSTIASVMIGMVIMISDIWMRSRWLGGRNSDDDNSSGNILALIGIIFMILAPFAGQMLRFALSRNREYLADATGAKYTGNPEGLASALEIISGADVGVRYASDATASMFISDPMVGLKSKKKKGNLFSTHPPIEERVRALRDMKYNMY